MDQADRERIVSELRANMRELRYLAEAPAQSFDQTRVSHGKSSGNAPMGSRSTEDECLAIYRDANHEVRRLVKRARLPDEGLRGALGVTVGLEANLAEELPPRALEIYEDANREVRQVIDRVKKRRSAEMTLRQKEYWIIYHGEGRRPEELAEQYQVTPSFVRRLRSSQRLYSETGQPGSSGRGRPRKAA